MRFQDYLQEKAILPPISMINAIAKKIEKCLRDNNELKNSIKEMNDIFKEYDILAYASGGKTNTDYPGLAGGEYDDNKGITYLEINSESFTNVMKKLKDGDDTLLKKFLFGIKNILSHELIHKGQVGKYSEDYKNDTRKQMKELDNLVKKHGEEPIIAYLNRKEEIMAWANTMIGELKEQGYNKDQILNMLKNTESNVAKLEKSYSFDTMYRILRQFNPKNWKRFLKIVVEYLEK